MKNILFILLTIFSLAVMATDVKTIYVDVPARVRIVKDSTFNYVIDTTNVKCIMSNDTVYFRMNNSRLDKTTILVSCPKNIKIATDKKKYTINN